MISLKDFHHYKGNNLTRFEKVEKKVIDLLFASKTMLQDDDIIQVDAVAGRLIRL